MKSKFITFILILLIIILTLSIFEGFSHENTDKISNKTQIRLCVDSPVELYDFINQTKALDYYKNINETTLNWLESLDSNHIVFSTGEAYYILSDYDVSKLPPLEMATDVSVYDICNCSVEENRNFGEGLANITLLGDVEYLYQEVEQYPV